MARWLEGWSGTEAPEREVEAGAFNMTPAEHVFRFSEWVLGLGLPDGQAMRCIEACKAGYAPHVLISQ